MTPMLRLRPSSGALAQIRRASLLLVFAAPLVTAAPSYRITDLGTMSGGDEWGSFALGINSAGQVVGYSAIAVPPPQTIVYPRAFVWQSSGGMTDLGALPGERITSVASDINNVGQIVGGSAVAGPGTRAVLWQADRSITNLGTLPGASDSNAQSINSAGQVVGSSGIRAFLWQADSGMQDLGTLPGSSESGASSINNAGQVVGFSGTSAGGATRAFLWQSGSGMIDLGGLRAFDINDVGQVVGITGDVFQPHAFLWQSGSAMIDLGAFPGGAGSSFANGINNIGQVVGWTTVADDHAFIWESDVGMVDLNALIDPMDPLYGSVVLERATAINDAGQIVGEGSFEGNTHHAFLLTPLPELPIAPSLLFGMFGVLAWTRSRARRQMAPGGMTGGDARAAVDTRSGD